MNCRATAHGTAHSTAHGVRACLARTQRTARQSHGTVHASRTRHGIQHGTQHSTLNGTQNGMVSATCCTEIETTQPSQGRGLAGAFTCGFPRIWRTFGTQIGAQDGRCQPQHQQGGMRAHLYRNWPVSPRCGLMWDHLATSCVPHCVCRRQPGTLGRRAKCSGCEGYGVPVP